MALSFTSIKQQKGVCFVKVVFFICAEFLLRVVCGWAMAVGGQVFVGLLKAIITNLKSKILFLKS